MGCDKKYSNICNQELRLEKRTVKGHYIGTWGLKSYKTSGIVGQLKKGDGKYYWRLVKKKN